MFFFCESYVDKPCVKLSSSQQVWMQMRQAPIYVFVHGCLKSRPPASQAQMNAVDKQQLSRDI